MIAVVRVGEVQEAYRTTGLVPATHVWLRLGTGNYACACGLGAVAVARGVVTRDDLSIGDGAEYDGAELAEKLGVSAAYVDGWVAGFDAEVEWPQRGQNEAEYHQGYEDGSAAAEAVLG